MSVDDVYEYLKKRRSWYTIHQIAEAVKISNGSTARSLRTLLKRKEVLRKRDTYKPNVVYWKAIV